MSTTFDLRETQRTVAVMATATFLTGARALARHAARG